MVTLLTAPGVEYRDPCWSPDGEHLLVSTNRATGHNFELWLVDADGSNAQQVTTYEGNVRRPVWQPRRLITMILHLRLVCLCAIIRTMMKRTANFHQLPRQDIGEGTAWLGEASPPSAKDGHGDIAWKPADAEIVKRPDVRAILEWLANL